MNSANLRLLRHAAMIVAGVLLFAFGTSQMIEGPVKQVAKAMRAKQSQIVTVSE